jgi:valyl-tRNA synthetase
MSTTSITEKTFQAKEYEAKWSKRWKETELYRWDPLRPREETFAIDTPPPTVSGSLHLGHVCSYTQCDILVRYHRMRGKNIFYPIGWDDNGLPTERRVQNYFKLKCDPLVPYDPSWEPKINENFVHISRENFIQACAVLTTEDEKKYEDLFTTLGHSYDWSLQYETINDHSRKISQLSFLDLVKKECVYNTESPTVWDCDFKSAIAQAEIEDRELQGAYHDIAFLVAGTDNTFVISTTRPELLPACIAVVAHPEDTRYKPLFGKKAITPLFFAEVPILPSEHADPEKGSGIMMVCTFGDIADVQYWKSSKLPLKQIISTEGRIRDIQYGIAPFTSTRPDHANASYIQLKSLTVKQAHRKIVELLSTEGSGISGSGKALIGNPKPTKHPVKFYEKGERPLEFIPTRQWFIKLLDYKEQFIQQGRKVKWNPEHMIVRYENWVNGLNQDWCISRQRYFGVPFPVWYRIGNDGAVNYDDPIFASSEELPVDPFATCPKGYTEKDRNQPNGFTGDPDVMDTWATSSVSPQVASHWCIDNERHNKLFPMDVRPQAHEIIRTWAFYTIVKAYFHHNDIPWKNAWISGWVLDPEGKKMSKSKGNVTTPELLCDKFSADALRYWSGRSKLGSDVIVDEGVIKIGQRLITKLANASKFALLQIIESDDLKLSEISNRLDKVFLQYLQKTVALCNYHFKENDYAQALLTAESTFWLFCDNYIELVKSRSYASQELSQKRSAHAALQFSIETFIKLLAPFIPFITEEIWEMYTKERKRSWTSIHLEQFPKSEDLAIDSHTLNESYLNFSVEILSKIRGAKTDAKKSLKHPVAKLEIQCSKNGERIIEEVLGDILNAGNVERQKIVFLNREELGDERIEVAVELVL